MGGRPNFLIVCDHGIRGGALDLVTWLLWFPHRRDWWPTNVVDDSVGAFDMDGNQRVEVGPIFIPWSGKPAEEEPTRSAIEIPCPMTRCSRRPYRSDAGKLQTLLELIAATPRFRDAFAVSAADAEITITLDALHAARDTARTRFRLKV